ncbi:amidohydrolase family protein [Alkalibacillus haloalkaliphilus]|uniref:amidohydrolase family protein n=1 Tax=Alkalibacillus haloalkaliphilus TaxID=94136 RepID=UPI00192A87AE|nr:amidohydrolase family protein [Alkalibacillus haloalkaliphilus]
MLIQDGIIIDVGRDDEVDIPASATVMDLNGHTLMPGLIDLHVHLGMKEMELGQELGPFGIIGLVSDFIRFTPDKRKSLLEHGITTVRSVGDEHEWIMEFRQLIQDGELEGPRLFTSGSLFTTLEGHPIATIGTDPDSEVVLFPDTPKEARDNVQEMVSGDEGVDLIKVVQERGLSEYPLEPIATDVLQAIVTEANIHNIPVTGHWGALKDLEELIEAGVDGLEHLGRGVVLNGWPEELLETIIEGDMLLTPTLTVETINAEPEYQQLLLERAEEFHLADGQFVVGTDAGMPGVFFGPSMYQELELLVKSGLSPQEALQAATSRAADALQSDEIGVIEPGRAADLIVIDGHPLQQIEDVQNVSKVFRDGRLVVEH